MSMLEAAIKYATEYGWKVFPVSAEDKTPLTPNGCKDAKDDIGAIRAWWKRFPDASIGVATGSMSNLVVIDEDIDYEKDLDGYEEILRWEREHEKLPDTVRSITGRGGYHLFYHYTDTDIRNRTGLLPGVDVRAEGGYVIVPPSRHPNGRSYEWEYAPEDMPIAEIDDTILELLTEGAPEESQSFQVPEIIEEGKRNSVLFGLASSLQSKGLPDNAIIAALNEVNHTNCVKPIPDDEVKRIAASAAKYKKGDLVFKKKMRQLKTAEDLMKRDIPEPKVMVGTDSELPLLVEGTCILSAKPKLGKSWFALSLCLAIAKGEDFLGYKTTKKSTLYLDLETSEVIQKKRLKKILHGKPVPKNFYLETEADVIGHGFVEQLEDYIKQDPELGVIIIDVFQMVRSPAKNFKETEYEHAYRDITPLNQLAQKHHISIILVCHDRKTVDPDDPFSNILGSTGLQGAVSQMIVMFKKKKTDPIHISVKGKTIDGLIDFNTKLDKAQWSIVEHVDAEDIENAQAEAEYEKSAVQEAIVTLVAKEGDWSGRCSKIIERAAHYGVAVTESPKQVGWFIRKHLGRFLKNDGILVSITNNGQGGKTYRFNKPTVDTVDKEEGSTVDGWESVSTMRADEIPFT